MIPTVYSGKNIFLLDVAPDWQDPFEADFLLVRDATAGLTNREGRRGYAAALRTNCRFKLTASSTDARRVAAGLRVYQKQPIAVPFWPAAVRWADRGARLINGGLNLAFKEDFSQFEIYEGVEPGWPGAGDMCAPLLWGRLDKRAVTWIHADALEFGVDFIEQSKAAWALMPSVVAFGAGPAPSVVYAVPPRFFPYELNFEGPQNEFRVEVMRAAIGFGREPLETVYPQADARWQELGYVQQGADIAGLLSFFAQHGVGKPFWASNWVNAVVLTVDIGPADTNITVLDTVAVGGDWLAFDAAGGVTTARIQSIVGNVIGLDGAPGAMPKGTLVSHLQLMRFEQAKLRVSWENLEVAEASLPLLELPSEYQPALDETLGVTLGLLPTRGFLYVVQRTLGGVVFTDRYTSFETDLTIAGGAYAGVYGQANIEHGEIKQGLYLEDDSATVTVVPAAGDVFVQAATMRLEGPLFVTILQADAAAGVASNVSVVFFGEATNAGPLGSAVKLKCVSGGSMFDRMVPRVRFQLGCNNTLFDPGCGLLKADWKFSGLVQTPPAGGYPFTVVMNTLAGVGAQAIAALAGGEVLANYFAPNGWVEFGAGANWQIRPILLSTVPVAGVLTLTLDRDPYPALMVGDALVLYPSCDLTWLTCQEKFGNLNFIGHPFMPASNPSVVKQQQTAGGKK